MDSKLSLVRLHMQSGDWQAAVRLAARFPRLGDQRNAILDAHSAYTNPRFMQQIGKDLNPQIAHRLFIPRRNSF